MHSLHTRCSKCGSTDRLEDHHVYPLCFFGNRVTNRYTVRLCEKHHDRLEDIIQGIESHRFDLPFGGRYQLEKEEYARILRNFLANSKVVYIDCWSLSEATEERPRKWIRQT